MAMYLRRIYYATEKEIISNVVNPIFLSYTNSLSTHNFRRLQSSATTTEPNQSEANQTQINNSRISYSAGLNRVLYDVLYRVYWLT